MVEVMLTAWGEQLDSLNPLPDYPRPQMVRADWTNLNGPWKYAIVDSQEDAVGPMTAPDWQGEIIVPFSPEVPLSGVNRTLMPSQTLWYQRTFTVEDGAVDGRHRVLLHFGAVDQSCRVAVDGVEVGGNIGGYLPFTIDITDALSPHASSPTEHTVTVAVRDVTDTSYFATGKQSSTPGGIWYTPQSGIWQTVWIEVVPDAHIHKLVFTPGLDSVEVTVVAGGEGTARLQIGAPALYRDGLHSSTLRGESDLDVDIPVNEPTVVPVVNPQWWSPENPFLYPVRVTYDEDEVTSYFALRTLGVGEREDGHPALLLNGEPYFAVGLLDQGYWPDGGYTAPADEALIFDITTAKDMGYNMLRKHIKVEPQRWYHNCDRLGMLVWQDAVNGGRPPRKSLQVSRAVVPYWLPDRPTRLLGRQDSDGLRMFAAELADMIKLLYSTPSVVMWVPFNEGWGQFDAALVAEMVRGLDPTRPVDHASGWFDQGGGDLFSRHVYFRPPTMVGRGRPTSDRRVLALTEYGGLGLKVPGHLWGRKTFGYQNYPDEAALAAAFAKLHAVNLPKVVDRGLGATVYTQLSDVEEEVNGLLTYDRRVLKIPAETVCALNKGLRERAAGL